MGRERNQSTSFAVFGETTIVDEEKKPSESTTAPVDEDLLEDAAYEKTSKPSERM